MKNILDKFRIDSSTYILMLFGLLSGHIKSVFLILIIVLIHEFGHVFFFFLFNIEIESIVIFPFGGVTKVNKKVHERIYKDVLISLGGIIFQIILYGLFYLMHNQGIVVKSTFELFKNYNISIIFFNLLPMIPLDGSKLYFALISKFFSYKISYLSMIVLGVISFLSFVVYNFIFKLNDLVIYIFLIIKIYEAIKNYKYIINRFYLERILYDNYYDGIVINSSIDKMKINKFYFFKDGKKLINEKKYILKKKF